MLLCVLLYLDYPYDLLVQFTSSIMQAAERIHISLIHLLVVA